MEKDGYISNEYHVGTEFCEIYRKSQTNIYSFFYPDLEKYASDMEKLDVIKNLSDEEFDSIVSILKIKRK